MRHSIGALLSGSPDSISTMSLPGDIGVQIETRGASE
jgi:hypothetical protein